MRCTLEMTPKLPLPILLTRRYFSISPAPRKPEPVGVDADARLEVAMAFEAAVGWMKWERGGEEEDGWVDVCRPGIVFGD